MLRTFHPACAVKCAVSDWTVLMDCSEPIQLADPA